MGITMAKCSSLSRSLLAASAAIACASPHAQTAATLEKVIVTGRGDPTLGVGGWGDVPLSKSPFQASVINTEQMRDLGVQRLSDVTRIDPSVSDAYNAEGYWDFLTVRGYVIDNRFNYRRDGLPINAETSIPLDNKERIEVLKGTSGLQAGTSAPGGLVNFVVKRPLADPLRSAQLAWRQPGSVLGAVDISERFGEAKAFGIRVNAAAEHLDPYAHSAKGERKLLAVSGEWRISSDTLLEAEFETSHRSQPSVPGFSLLGPNVPAPGDPRINLNNQPWSLPVVLDGNTASVRFSQALSAGWRWTGHAATQQLTSQDRIAFPFGCGAEGNFDRYCSDGTFDLYDFRSENEHRRTDALELALHGSLNTGGASHSLSAGVLRSRYRARFQPEAFNLVGTGNVQGTLFTAPDPTTSPAGGDRDEYSTELFARDAVRFGPSTTAWLGLRHTRLSRDSAGTPYSQGLTTPWFAVSQELAADQLVYASWGQGMESAVTPRLPQYGPAAGAALPALKSRQIELGTKGHVGSTAWSVAWFDIDRPIPTDTGTAFFIDGSAHHRGIEAGVTWQSNAWLVQSGVQFLHARREGSQTVNINGTRPTNVPAATFKLLSRYDLASLPGLSIDANLMAESNRMVLEDNSVRVPGYGRVDLATRYTQRTSTGTFTWRAGIDNLFDRRAWKESPLEFGHVYLFPLAPRTVRLSIEAAL